jgi:hypothetical protein
VKRDASRTPRILFIAAVLCVVIAIGAALEGRFNFSGPRWTPGQQNAPVKASTPTPQPSASVAAPHLQRQGTQFLFNWTPIIVALAILAAIALAVLVRMLVRWQLRRVKKLRVADVAPSPIDLEIPPEPAADIPILRRGLDLASEMLTTEREPRDAIVRAWIGLQQAAEDSGMSRRPAETPTEFTSRVFASVDADRVAAASLLAVYLRVRFGSRPATADDVRVALQAVEALQSTWVSGAAK